MPDVQLESLLADRYRVIRELGTGGMATVYLARDVRHDRAVALKVLKPDLAAILGAERFLSEIRVTANLQHPHLLPLFDSGESNGLLFYVMPFVDGESLRARLDREKQLPIDDAVRIAVAVAGALEYAHEHGVIHRDLKPENILLQAGQPVVADFGIALAISHAGGARLTQTGLSLGTPAYMSPEQATGDRALDARTDIYSLAAVLFELLAGDPPHAASTAQAVIAKVMTQRPPNVQSLRPNVPDHLAQALDRGLEKLPADRFSNAQQFAEALRLPAVTRRSDAPRTTPEPAPLSRLLRRAVRYAPWAIAAAVLASAIVTRPESRTEPVVARFDVPLPDSVTLDDRALPALALSPDGSRLTFVARTRRQQRWGAVGYPLYVRELNDSRARAFAGVTDANVPSFSPDSKWILYVAGSTRQLRKIAVTGGPSARVVDVGDSFQGASWGDRNEIVYSLQGDLWRVSADGGAPRLVAHPDSTRRHLRYTLPEILPGGDAALITIRKGSGGSGDDELGIVTLPGGVVTELGIAGFNPRYVATGHVIYAVANGPMSAVAFSLRKRAVTGATSPVLADVHPKQENRAVDVSVARNGTLAYSSGVLPISRLVAVQRDGAARFFADHQLAYDAPRLSRDGRRVVFVTPRRFIFGPMWVYDSVLRAPMKVTGDSVVARPEWTPDGSHFIYSAAAPMRIEIRSRAWDGTSTGKPVWRADSGSYEVSIAPSGARIVVRVGGLQRNRHLEAVALDSPRVAQTITTPPAREWAPRISPNGRWLAYVSDETDSAEVYVRPFPGPGRAVRVSQSGGTEPMWSRDGSELFYRSPTHLVSATVADRGELDVLRRTELFEDHFGRDADHANYDVFPSGREFLMIQPESESAKLVVIVNWTEELRRKVSPR